MLHFIAQTYPQLQNLEIEFQSDKYYSINADGIAIFEQLERCTLIVFNASMLNEIPVGFLRVETLALEIKRAASKDIIRYILRHHTLRNLQIKFGSSLENYLIDYNDLIELTTLPNIENIFIQVPVAISGHDVIQYVSRCKSVQKLYIHEVRSQW